MEVVEDKNSNEEVWNAVFEVFPILKSSSEVCNELLFSLPNALQFFFLEIVRSEIIRFGGGISQPIFRGSWNDLNIFSFFIDLSNVCNSIEFNLAFSAVY